MIHVVIYDKLFANYYSWTILPVVLPHENMWNPGDRGGPQDKINALMICIMW